MAVTLVWPDDSGANVIMAFDITSQETHDLITTVTEFPVEVGSDIADHVRDELPTITLEGFVSDTGTSRMQIRDDVFERRQNVGTITAVELQIPEKPLKFGASALIGAGISAIGNLLSGGGALKAKVLTFDDFKSRKKIVFDLLNEARLSHRKIRIVTDLTEYDEMLITQLTPTRSPDDGDGATYVVTLRKIITVESELTVAPSPAEALGSSQKAAGSKSAEQDKDLVDGKKKSFAKKMVEATGKYVDENGGVAGALVNLIP